MSTCTRCQFATKLRVAFDDERLFCSHPDAHILGMPVGFVGGDEARHCGCYQEGQPRGEDLLIPVELHDIPVRAAAGFFHVGN